jgi:hypothetical protein
MNPHSFVHSELAGMLLADRLMSLTRLVNNSILRKAEE